jgi:deazaflavin-dependent oxidoreductase (nitroreductase family)
VAAQLSEHRLAGDYGEAMTEVHDSPAGWVADHIQRYVETDGADGQFWRGVPTLLLTTTGRKSGKLRRTALIYGEHDGSYLVVASQGGADQHPAWYLNLTDHPEVQLQVGADKLTATARTASDAERSQLWPKMVEIWPDYDNYQAKTDRQIPIVILDPSQ